MPDPRDPRRQFLKAIAGLAAAGPALAQAPVRPAPSESIGPKDSVRAKPRIRFAVIGLNHGHVHGLIAAVVRGGGELASFYAREGELVQDFAKRYPLIREARGEDEILQDETLQLVVSASIPDERAPLGIRTMLHGKDFLVDKPGVTTLEQLAEVRRVQAETKRIFSILYSERHEHPATVRAGELVAAGAIGRVVQTIGLGPHRTNAPQRPAWFFDRKRFGGILTDIASHQADQFLFFTGSTRAEVLVSQVGNTAHQQYPDFEDFGDMVLAGDGGTGYIRVDWLTPDGLGTWGDGRLTILGTEGFIEIRKNVDIAGRPEGNHLFLVDRKETRHIDCREQDLPFGGRFVSDIVNRTETAMPQAHCFLATELVLRAQQQARRLGR